MPKRPLRLFKKNNKRFVKLKKKRYNIKSNLVDADLVKYIIDKMAPIKRRRTKGAPKKLNAIHTTTPPQSTGWSDPQVERLKLLNKLDENKKKAEEDAKKKAEEDAKKNSQITNIENQLALIPKDIKKQFKKYQKNQIASSMSPIPTINEIDDSILKEKRKSSIKQKLKKIFSPTKIEEELNDDEFILKSKDKEQRLKKNEIDKILQDAKKGNEVKQKEQEENEKEIKRIQQIDENTINTAKLLFNSIPKNSYIAYNPIDKSIITGSTQKELYDNMKNQGIIDKKIGSNTFTKNWIKDKNLENIPDTNISAIKIKTSKQQTPYYYFGDVKNKKDLGKLIPEQPEEPEEPEKEPEEEEEQDGQGKGNDGLYDYQINEFMNSLKLDGWLGCISSNEILSLVPKIKPHKRISFIMNLDPDYMKGSHWVACYIDPKNDLSLEYFDSYADEPTKRFTKDIKKVIEKLDPNYYLKFKINRLIHQRENSNSCGYFSMKFIIDRYNGIPFKDCSGYSDILKSETNLKHFKKQVDEFDYI